LATLESDKENYGNVATSGSDKENIDKMIRYTKIIIKITNVTFSAHGLSRGITDIKPQTINSKIKH
jgi:hypothetical protein